MYWTRICTICNVCNVRVYFVRNWYFLIINLFLLENSRMRHVLCRCHRGAHVTFQTMAMSVRPLCRRRHSSSINSRHYERATGGCCGCCCCCSRSSPLKRAFNSVSLSLKERELFGLLDPNGAGKSTSMKFIVGDEAPSEGAIYCKLRWFGWTLRPCILFIWMHCSHRSLSTANRSGSWTLTQCRRSSTIVRKRTQRGLVLQWATSLWSRGSATQRRESEATDGRVGERAASRAVCRPRVRLALRRHQTKGVFALSQTNH